MNNFRLSRRTVLRGLGVSMALPALEIMEPRRAYAQTNPLRFLCVYSPNGPSALESRPSSSMARGRAIGSMTTFRA